VSALSEVRLSVLSVPTPTLWYLELGYRRSCVKESIIESVHMAVVGVIPRSLLVFFMGKDMKIGV